MDFKGKTLLVIVPHPDDETLAAGGFMTRVKAEGGKVYVMAMATGEQRQYGSTSESLTRKAELDEAMKLIGADGYDLVLDDSHHLKLDRLPRKDLVDIIESRSSVSVSKVRPDILVFPGSSYSQDHNAVYEACITATRPYPTDLKFTPRLILLFSHFDEQTWNTTATWQSNNFWVNISEYVDLKTRLLNCYKSQIKAHTAHWRTVDNILHINRISGLRTGVEAAEEFYCIRSLV